MIASLVWELLGSAGQFWVERSQQSRAVESVPAQLGVHLLYCWIPPSFVGTMNVKHTRPWHRKCSSQEGVKLAVIISSIHVNSQARPWRGIHSAELFTLLPRHSHIFSRLGHSRPGHRGNGATEKKSESCLQPHHCQENLRCRAP